MGKIKNKREFRNIFNLVKMRTQHPNLLDAAKT